MTLLRSLRILRIVRFVKIFRYVKELWLLVNAFFVSSMTLFWVGVLLTLIVFVFGIFSARVIGDIFPGEKAHFQVGEFDSLGESMYTLFVILTLEGWPDTIGEFSPYEHPERWPYLIFFLLYIVVGHFLVMNLFVAVIVEHVTSSASTHDIELMKSLKNK